MINLQTKVTVGFSLYVTSYGAMLCIVGVLFFCAALRAEAATMSLGPATGVYTSGQSFTARVVVNTEGKSVNAADGTISFNPSELSVVAIAKGTMFNLWTAEPSFSNTTGKISFSGGNPTGYSGTAGTVLTITFKANGSGTANISFSGGSVLAADGRGTNILTNMTGGSYTIGAATLTPTPETVEYIAPANTPSAPVITSTTHPNSANYYKETTAQLAWFVPDGVTAIRTLLDSNSGTIPTKVYDTPERSIALTELNQGVQYFHLQFKNSDGWGKVTHYRLAIDSEKPSSFTISLPENADLSNPIQTLILDTKDETSTVKRFLVQLDGGEPFEYIDETTSGTIMLPSLEPGHHSVIIEAFDEAGNSLISTFSFSILSFDRPQFTDYPSEINEEVIPVIKGITRPNASVQLSLNKIGADTQTISLESGSDGVFVFIPDSTFSVGVYELEAVAIDQFGAKSEVSETIRIAVQQPGYVRIGSLIVSILSIIIPLVALLSLLGVLLFFTFYRLRRIRRGVIKESDEALKIVTDEFAAIELAIATQVTALADSRKTKKLTKAEEVMIETVRQALDKARTRVRKEVQDVEDVVE